MKRGKRIPIPRRPLPGLLAAVLAVLLAAPALAAPAARKAARDPFLEEIQRRAFLFFWQESEPSTGITKDRARNFEKDDFDVGSIASTGFALTALPIGVEHGWVSRARAQQRALTTLRFFRDRVEGRHGVFPHFLELKTGRRAWQSEFSTIDTTLLVCGALAAGQYFGGEVKRLADDMYRAVDWRYWSPRTYISHGSRPEEGEFLAYDYGGYSEAMLMYVIAIGSPTHPVPAERWHTLPRHIARYGPYSSIAGSSLFVNQYPNLWVDFRGKHDRYADYWQNARANTLANRQFCIDNMGRYRTYAPDVWGLTASDGPDGYRAYAAEPGGAFHDGTVSPHAAGGSYMFTPVESRRALKTMLDRYRPKVWGRYGFIDSFNVDRDWWDTDVIGIDTGATLLSIENHRTGLPHRLFMAHPAVQLAMRRIGFRPTPAAPAPAVRVAGASPAATVTFTLPAAPPKAWKGRAIVLYGGVAQAPVAPVLNGRSLGRHVPAKDRHRPVAFPAPPAALRWGQRNRLTFDAPPGNWGPVWVGPRESVEWKPLWLDAAP